MCDYIGDTTLQLPKGFNERVLRFVEFRHGFEIVEPRAGKVLLRLNGLQDGSDSELLPRLRQAQSLFRRFQGASARGNLVGGRPQAGKSLDHLPTDFVPDLLFGQPGPLETRFGRLLATGIKQTSGPDPPAQPNG